jgi:hypothetical protein
MKKMSAIIKSLCLACCILTLFSTSVAGQSESADSSESVIDSLEVTAVDNATAIMKFSLLPQIAVATVQFDSITGCELQIYSYMEKEKKAKGPLDPLTVIENIFRREARRNAIRICVAWEATGKWYNIRTYASSNVGDIFSQKALKVFTDSLNDRYSETLDAIVEPQLTYQKIMSALSNLRASANILEYKTEDIKAATKTAINDAKSSRGKTAAACNICVRSAIWNVATSSALFPEHGAFIGNQQSSYLYGRVSKRDPRYPNDNAYIGTANSIAVSLAATGVVPEFIAIPNMTGVAIPDFKQLQTWANDGQIIVGVLKNDNESGHVVMLVPHSDDLGNVKIYAYRDILSSKVEYLMPKILECGRGRREEVYTLQAGVTSAKIQNMKWYKMVGIYTSPKNNVK